METEKPMPAFDELGNEELLGLSQDTTDELKKRGFEYGWHRPVRYAGAIYILVNPAFPELVKIGYADDVKRRMKSLNRNSGLPDPYHCYVTYEVKKRLKDLRLHNLIDVLDPDLRHTCNREFFEMSPEKAYGILSAIAEINGDIDRLQVNPLGDPYFGDVCVPEAGMQAPEEKRQRKPRLSFGALGIPVGTSLTYIDDPRVTVKVANDKSNVLMADGTKKKLSAAVRVIKEARGEGNTSGSYQGGLFFMFEGETLVDRRARLEKAAEEDLVETS